MQIEVETKLNIGDVVYFLDVDDFELSEPHTINTITITTVEKLKGFGIEYSVKESNFIFAEEDSEPYAKADADGKVRFYDADSCRETIFDLNKLKEK